MVCTLHEGDTAWFRIYNSTFVYSQDQGSVALVERSSCTWWEMEGLTRSFFCLHSFSWQHEPWTCLIKYALFSLFIRKMSTSWRLWDLRYDLMYWPAAHKLQRGIRHRILKPVRELWCTILVLLRHTPLITNGPSGCDLNSTWLFVDIEYFPKSFLRCFQVCSAFWVFAQGPRDAYVSFLHWIAQFDKE